MSIPALRILVHGRVLDKLADKFAGEVVGLVFVKAGFEAGLVEHHHCVCCDAYALNEIVDVVNQWRHPLPLAGSGEGL